METKLTEETRVESDLIGAREIPASALYGVQTLRGIENFPISKFHLNEYPLFINGLAITKMAAAMANYELGLLTKEQKDAIVLACQEINQRMMLIPLQSILACIILIFVFCLIWNR